MPTPGESPVGLWGFVLEVDGVLLEHDFVLRSVDNSISPPQFFLHWVYNFPGGMTGTHTFTGHWMGPCQVLVDNGDIPGPCDNPNQVVEALARTVVVTFQ
jgi:hypothetical protein